MDNLYLTYLYDIYGELLTEKQKLYFEDYYFNNLSLSEMSENYDVTRTAIHNLLKSTEEKLKYFESVLKLYDKKIKIEKVIKNYSEKDKKEIENILF